jgi:Family of unknown function (DUF5908)
MPVEIKELVVKTIIEKDSKSTSGKTNLAEDAALTRKFQEMKNQILQECLTEVAAMMANSNER